MADDTGSCASFGRGASGWMLGYVAVSGTEVWMMSTLVPLEEAVRELLVLVLVPLPKPGDPELPERDEAAAKKSHH